MFWGESLNSRSERRAEKRKSGRAGIQGENLIEINGQEEVMTKGPIRTLLEVYAKTSDYTSLARQWRNLGTPMALAVVIARKRVPFCFFPSNCGRSTSTASAWIKNKQKIALINCPTG